MIIRTLIRNTGNDKYIIKSFDGIKQSFTRNLIAYRKRNVHELIQLTFTQHEMTKLVQVTCASVQQYIILQFLHLVGSKHLASNMQ